MMEWVFAAICFCCIGGLMHQLALQFFALKKLDNTCTNLSVIQNGLSLIICTKGASILLIKYLEKFINQDYTKFEIVLIYNELDREIKEKLESIMASSSIFSMYELHTDIVPYHEKKQALHFGIQHAKFDWIVTSDDDCYPSSDQWFNEINKIIGSKNPDIVLGISPYILQNSFINKWIRYDGLLVAQSMILETNQGRPYMGIGRNMAFKKALWSESYLEKFKNIGHGDDSSLVQFYAADKTIVLLCQPVVYSFPKLNLKDWLIQKNRHISCGKLYKIKTLFRLSLLPVFSVVFWGIIWTWMSYFSVNFWVFILVFFYLLLKSMIILNFEIKLNVKHKVFFYVFFFDLPHSLYLILAPLLGILLPKRWK